MTPKPLPLRTLRPSRRAQAVTLGSVLVILVAALAGCTANDDVDPDGQDDPKNGKNGNTNGGANGGGQEGEQGSTPYRFSDENLSALEMTATGAFSATEHCLPVSCFTGGDGHLEYVDLEEIVPVGIPVRIDVELESDAEITAGVIGRFLSEGALWNVTPAQQSGSQGSIIAALPDGDAKLYYVIEGLFPNPGSDTQWTLHAEATPLTERIPEGFVVGFEVDDPQRPPAITSTGFSVGTFMLWDPDDEYVGTYRTDSNTSKPFHETGKSGEYVLFVPWGEDQLELESHAEAAAPALLRPLGMSRTMGDFHAPAPEAPAQWDFPVETTALAVGLLFYAENGYTHFEEYLHLESPDGVVHDGQLCGFCSSLIGRSENLLWFDASHTIVVPGTYQVHYENTGHGTEVADIVWDYER